MIRRISPAFAGAMVLGFLAIPAQAAGFDCAKAKSPTEKAICADKLLSELDGHLARYYTVAAEAVGDGAACLKADQRQWVKSVRDACGVKTACLKSAYLKRLATFDGLQPGASALKTIELPAAPALIAAIPPEAEPIDVKPGGVFERTGKLVHEAEDINAMGYAVKPAKGPVKAFVYDISIDGTPAHRAVALEIETGSANTYLVRGREADGGFHDGQCRYVYRMP
ncbi:MAG: DUF1311 domain-containing protein [Phyllobacteriaceae bacterium]|nr:DUF1311 domain-containing protein [Phyllobacteriaceae bacterium]